MALACELCKTSIETILLVVPGVKTAEGAARAAELILEFLDEHGIHVPKEKLVKIIVDNIKNGRRKVAEMICESVGACS